MLKEKTVLGQQIISNIKLFFEYFILRFWMLAIECFIAWFLFSGTSIEVIGNIAERFFNDLSFIPEKLLTILIVAVPLLFWTSIYYFCCKFEGRKDN